MMYGQTNIKDEYNVMSTGHFKDLSLYGQKAMYFNSLYETNDIEISLTTTTTTTTTTTLMNIKRWKQAF